jgi:CheY-like chemotaxis protein
VTIMVLVVEDEPDIRLTTRLMLEGAGYAVTEASTGKEALSKLSEQRPDVVLLDIRLPDVEGWDVLRSMRSSASLGDVPVLIMSAHTGGDFQERAALEGSEGYLVKPFRESDLIASVKRLLQAC